LKNAWLKQARGVDFEEVIIWINEKKVIEIREHPNRQKYPNQHLYIIQHENYIYVVPFVRKGNEVFLKTIYPSQRLTKSYLKN
jgi:hypothetical protein